jgi:diguanylate cyclase (GGDEF)-like protein
MKRRARKGSRRPRALLLLQFGLVSAVLTAVLGAALSAWLTNFVRTTNVNHARDMAEYSVGLSVAAIGWPGQQPLMTAAQLALTTHLMQASVASGKYVAVSVWMPGDIVAYAAESARIGKREWARPQVNAALAGQQGWAVVTRPLVGVDDPSERAALARFGPLLETFTPIRLKNQVVATTALYQKWRPVQRTIELETRNMLLIIMAGIALLWLGLMRLVLSTSRQLRTQAATNWQLASHDQLTGLPNRKLLHERVGQALHMSQRSGRHVGVLLFDLNRFKEVNDTLGHHGGDLLLEQIGPRLQRVLREGDFIGRLGGDEFVVLLPALDDPLEAAATAKRLTAALAEPFLLEGVSLDVDASIGIAISPQHGTNFDQLIQHADTGMYEAKASGSGYATYSASNERVRPKKLALRGPAAEAVNDRSQLVS